MRRPALLAPQAAASRWERAAARSRRDQSGGAVSLWVVLMVPVSAFAAVVAMAGPQRMAAESSMDEAAEDFATLAVAWRDGRGKPRGSLPAFPPECIDSETKEDAVTEDGLAFWKNELKRLKALDDPENPEDHEQSRQNARDMVAKLIEQIEQIEQIKQQWEEGCKFLFESMLRDLGHLGVDMGTLRGFYSDSLTTGELEESSDPPLPCKISPQVEVRDAVHVALAADWRYAGWATAQVWPDGARMGATSIGRLRRTMNATSQSVECGFRLDVFDSQGRLVWLDSEDGPHPSRELSQSVPGRTVVEG